MTAPLRRTFAHTPPPQIRPNLMQLQHQSFDWFVDPDAGGLRALFDEVGAMSDYAGNIRVEFGEMVWGDISASVRECKVKDMTYAKPLHVKVLLTFLDTGEIMEQLVFFGDMPWMTERGTFVIGGTERVVINQLVRAPGAYIMPGKEGKLLQAALMPSRGSWLDMELDRKGRMQVRIDRKKRFPYTILLSALGYSKDEVLAATDDSLYVRRTYDEAGEYTLDADAAAIEIFKRQRPGEPPSIDGARALVDGLFFDPKRYDLTPVGRYKLNQRLGNDLPADHLTLDRSDLLLLAKAFSNIPRVLGIPEDDEQAPADVYGAARGLSVHLIDHLLDEYEHFANRRVRAVGELVQESMRTGWQRSERAIRERLTVQDRNEMTPQSVVNVRPLIASVKEFFGSSQLSQFMDQDNALAGLTHRRRLSGLGPGGLARERAPLEVRDVHPTHYGRMCPIETPEGPNIGLMGSLTSYASVNDYGFLTTPYRQVEGGRINDELVWLDAGEEANRLIAPASTPIDGDRIVGETAIARTGGGRYVTVTPEEIELIDLSTDQLWSISTGLIPFLEHDDANRALMGSNMQRQAVPLVRPGAPLIGTGMESWAGRDSGEAILAREAGTVSYVDATVVRVKSSKTEREYNLDTWQRSNQGTLIHQRPIVVAGDKVAEGDVLADGSSTDHGEIALGRNLTVAFMPWEGYNFEDSIILSSKVVTENLLTSVHIESYEVEARDTKLGREEITRDIPNRSEESLRNLDEHGIIRIGAKVGSGDILVGKVTPKGDTDLTAEEKLIRAIFKEQAKEVRDTSLKVPHGSGGVVIDVKTFTRADGDDLQPGVHELVRVFVAQRRPIREGDKLAGRHGNKGVVSRIIPVHDMPHLADGTAVDVILNPLGVPSRMNIGQILETHLGWVSLNGFGESDEPIPVATPVFNGAGVEEVDTAMFEYAKRRPEQGMVVDESAPAGRKASGTYTLYNGRTGEPFDRPVTVGVMYILKLHHLVDDKIHARSTGPYSLITQQPLGGKAQFGGQRFGEMEVWALEAYGAAYTLQEMLTIKSDDVVGRVKAYEAIVKGENIEQPSVPESFRVLLKEMQALGLRIDLEAEEDPEADAQATAEEDAFIQAAQDLAFNFAGFEERDGGLPLPTDTTTDAQAEAE